MLTFNVTPLSDTPVVGDDVATTPEDTPITIDVLANDSDADPGDVLTIIAVNDTPIRVGSTPIDGARCRRRADRLGHADARQQARLHPGA